MLGGRGLDSGLEGLEGLDSDGKGWTHSLRITYRTLCVNTLGRAFDRRARLPVGGTANQAGLQQGGVKRTVLNTN